MKVKQGFLPIPDEFESVINSDNRLPLEYIPAEWFLLVCSDASRREFIPVRGDYLHSNWEISTFHHFSQSSRNSPPTAFQIACPNGSYLAIHIISYDFFQCSQPK